MSIVRVTSALGVSRMFLCLEPIKVQKYEDGSIYSNEIVASIEKLTLRYQEQKFRNERFKPTLLRYRQQKRAIRLKFIKW